jgi:STE24 endopeptidase
LAAARTNAEHGRLAFSWAAGGFTLAALLKTRVLARLCGWLDGKVSGAGVASVLCTAAFVSAYQLLQIPFTLIAQALWPQGGAMETAGSLVAGVVLALLCGVPSILLLQIVAKVSPRRGWAWLSLAAAISIFCTILIPPVALSPGVRGDRPASAPAAARMLTFVRMGGLKTSQIYVFPDKDPLAVDAEGLGPITHAAVGQAALYRQMPEAFAGMGHLLGHYRHHDLWWMAALWSILVCALLWTTFKFYAPLARALGSGLPQTLWASTALPLLGLIVWTFLLPATMAFNVFDQVINYRADDYAIGLTHDPDALCRWLIATEQGSKADPSPLESLIFYDHPPLQARLQNALRWKTRRGL